MEFCWTFKLIFISFSLLFWWTVFWAILLRIFISSVWLHLLIIMQSSILITYLFLKKNWYIILLQFFVSFCYTRSEPVICIQYLLPLGSPSPIQSIHVITEHWAELPVLYSRFPLAFYFTGGSVFMSNLIFQFIPPSSSLQVSTCWFSVPASSLPALQLGSLVPFFKIPCTWVNIFFFPFLTYFTLQEGVQICPPVYRWLNFVPFYGWKYSIVYMYHIFFIC